jgi:hypothetical protein
MQLIAGRRIVLLFKEMEDRCSEGKVSAHQPQALKKVEGGLLALCDDAFIAPEESQ